MAAAPSGRLTAVLVALTALTAFALWLTPVALASVALTSDVALDAIDSCVRKLNPDVDVGYERIVARCPDLVVRLEQGRWAAWLPRDWKRPNNDLSAGGLRELRELLANAPDAGNRAPSVASLPAVLASLAQQDSAAVGWWTQTRTWLREAFERREQATGEGWLARLIAQNGLSQAVLEIVSYAALALVVVLAGAILVNELRVGGALGRLRKRFAARPAFVRAGVPHAGPTRADVQNAAVLQRPRVLLELIIACLAEDSRLPPARGLTVRELTRLARLPDQADRDRLAELARVSERVRFSNTGVSEAAITTVVEDGWLLLGRLRPRAAIPEAGRHP